MKYKLIIFDIDGTITTHISSWRYIHEKLGIWDALAERYQEKFLAGKISYKRFCELDAAHWKGMPVKRLEKIFKKVRYSKNIIPSIGRLRRMGFKLVAISTGLQFMTDRVKKELGFDYAMSNRLGVRNGRLTGRAKINIAHGAKGRALAGIMKKFRVKPHEVIAIGDTDGDIPMAKLAGYSIAFNSSGKSLSKMVDYNCKSKDFRDVVKRISVIS
jgi:phosphoserine phosphatase